MRYVKTYESFSINEEFSIKAQIKKGMEKMKELLENNTEIQQKLKENYSKLSDKQKEELKRPGLIKKIKDFFNTDDAEAIFGRSAANKVRYMVSESAESIMEKALDFLWKFFGISGAILLFGGLTTTIFAMIAEHGLLGAIGAGAFCIGWLIVMTRAHMEED